MGTFDIILVAEKKEITMPRCFLWTYDEQINNVSEKWKILQRKL